jgi:2-polyprenyl-3-methyl-5-hydroxy-6-metoxy-1,4-benzoquinol methylase
METTPHAAIHASAPADYFAQSRPEVLHFVPESARRILDVGCAEGRFGEALKRLVPEREIWGVEINPAAAANARARLHRVIAADVTTLSAQDLPEGYFDAITFTDSLEHMQDPSVVLKNLKSKLAPQGVFVISVPNVRYLYNLWHVVVEKDWRYEPAGILDRTHLRFFTEKSLRRFLTEELGFELLRLEGINRLPSWKFDVLNAVTLGFLRDTRCTQYVAVVRPGQSK